MHESGTQFIALKISVAILYNLALSRYIYLYIYIYHDIHRYVEILFTLEY